MNAALLADPPRQLHPGVLPHSLFRDLVVAGQRQGLDEQDV